MHINNQIFLWDQATVKLLDVRQIEMVQSEILQKYKIPASIFLLSVHGSAQVQLDQAEFSLQDFKSSIAGKGRPSILFRQARNLFTISFTTVHGFMKRIPSKYNIVFPLMHPFYFITKFK